MVQGVVAEVKELAGEVEGFLARGKGPPATLGRDGFHGADRPLFALPRSGQWTLDAKGELADPVTVYVHGMLEQIESALKADGWTPANAGSLASNVRYVGAATAQETLDGVAGLNQDLNDWLHRPLLPEKERVVRGVQQMPVSLQSLAGRLLLAAYERNNEPLGGRDHLRIFDTGQKDAQERPVYAIAASRDSGIKFAPHHPETAFLFHAVQPDVSGERAAVVQSLELMGARVLHEVGLGWAGASVYGEKVADGLAYDVAMP